jgi:murein DD-endopeptidase MepM/ murein hydrolase activator NlpD
MGDHRAGTTGTTATTPPSPPVTSTGPGEARGRRVALTGSEQRLSQPYAGRRVAQVAPMPVEAMGDAESLSYRGRRVAGRNPVVQAAAVQPLAPAGRRIALDPELMALPGDAEDVVGHLLQPTAAPTLDGYVGRRVARPVDLITEPTVVKRAVVAPAVAEPAPAPKLIIAPPAILLAPPAEPTEDSIVTAPAVRSPLTFEPVLAEPVLAEPVLAEPVLAERVVDEPVVDEVIANEPAADEPVANEPLEETTVLVDAAELVEPVLAAHPELDIEPPTRVDTLVASPVHGDAGPKRARTGGRRVASRRTRVPSLPLLAGVAVLAISAGGALQAAHPGLTSTDADGRISPASALSGSSAVGSASLLGGRSAAVSRDSDRQALSAAQSSSLQAAADQQVKERDAALSALAGKAEKQSAEIKLHQWVLPVDPAVYHLTARFGDYSSLWAHFHTGLDFAAPTGTPIMAVAGGTITEVGYSGDYGNRTIETLPDGTQLWYCHQNEFGTSVGAKVKAGQVIGYVGSTGNVTGPHLHLEVHPGGGDAVDPYAALVAHGLYPGPPA